MLDLIELGDFDRDGYTDVAAVPEEHELPLLVSRSMEQLACSPAHW